MRFWRPVTAAERVTAPVWVPSVTVVAAMPDASVATGAGASSTLPPPPEASKLTFAPTIGRPLASATFTEKVPTEVVTAPLGLGSDTTTNCDGGPTFGQEASEPHARRGT